MHILVCIKRLNILILYDIVDGKNSSDHEVAHLRMHVHRIDADRDDWLSITDLEVAHLLTLLLLELIHMHILIHLVHSHIVWHSIYLLQAVESVKMLILLIE